MTLGGSPVKSLSRRANMLLERNRTAFDIDGVVADIVTPFLRVLDERHGYKGFTADDITNFDLENALGLPGRIVDEIVGEILDAPLELGTTPYPGAAEVLRRLCRREPLLFITSRPTPEPIRDWFLAALPELPQDRVEIIATGDPAKKGDCLREKNRLHFIDDYLETCRQLDQAGFCPVVFDQPWNRNDDKLPRVRGWAGIARIFGLE